MKNHITSSHTFATLRRVESFLQLPCFDYSAYALVPTTVAATGSGAVSGGSGGGSGVGVQQQQEQDDNDEKSSSSTTTDVAGADFTSPPRRAPRTVNEKVIVEFVSRELD